MTRNIRDILKDGDEAELKLYIDQIPEGECPDNVIEGFEDEFYKLFEDGKLDVVDIIYDHVICPESVATVAIREHDKYSLMTIAEYHFKRGIDLYDGSQNETKVYLPNLIPLAENERLFRKYIKHYNLHLLIPDAITDLIMVGIVPGEGEYEDLYKIKPLIKMYIFHQRKCDPPISESLDKNFMTYVKNMRRCQDEYGRPHVWCVMDRIVPHLSEEYCRTIPSSLSDKRDVEVFHDVMRCGHPGTFKLKIHR